MRTVLLCVLCPVQHEPADFFRAKIIFVFVLCVLLGLEDSTWCLMPSFSEFGSYVNSVSDVNTKNTLCDVQTGFIGQ